VDEDEDSFPAVRTKLRGSEEFEVVPVVEPVVVPVVPFVKLRFRVPVQSLLTV
jgi:hypothetical protein